MAGDDERLSQRGLSDRWDSFDETCGTLETSIQGLHQAIEGFTLRLKNKNKLADGFHQGRLGFERSTPTNNRNNHAGGLYQGGPGIGRHQHPHPSPYNSPPYHPPPYQPRHRNQIPLLEESEDEELGYGIHHEQPWHEGFSRKGEEGRFYGKDRDHGYNPDRHRQQRHSYHPSTPHQQPHHRHHQFDYYDDYSPPRRVHHPPPIQPQPRQLQRYKSSLLPTISIKNREPEKRKGGEKSKKNFEVVIEARKNQSETYMNADNNLVEESDISHVEDDQGSSLINSREEIELQVEIVGEKEEEQQEEKGDDEQDDTLVNSLEGEPVEEMIDQGRMETENSSKGFHEWMNSETMSNFSLIHSPFLSSQRNQALQVINQGVDETTPSPRDKLHARIPSLFTDEIREECKIFFFARHETTSNLLTWTMFLLSTNLEWHEKLREEVTRECGTGIPSADNLSKLKMVGMVLLETLRLYGPVGMIARMASQDMKLGNVMIPKGMAVFIPFAIIHRNKELWGDDVDKVQSVSCSGRCACNSDAGSDPSKLGTTNGVQPCQYQSVISVLTPRSIDSIVNTIQAIGAAEFVLTMDRGLDSQHVREAIFPVSVPGISLSSRQASQALWEYYDSQTMRGISGCVISLGANARIAGGRDAIYTGDETIVASYSSRGLDVSLNRGLISHDLDHVIFDPGGASSGGYTSLDISIDHGFISLGHGHVLFDPGGPSSGELKISLSCQRRVGEQRLWDHTFPQAEFAKDGSNSRRVRFEEGWTGALKKRTRALTKTSSNRGSRESRRSRKRVRIGRIRPKQA